MKPSKEPREQEPTEKRQATGSEKNANATLQQAIRKTTASDDNQDTPPVTKSGFRTD
jgi:hypothetical protein